MDHLLDEAARILASPVPRRQALRLLTSALVTGVVSMLGIKRAEAQGCSPPCRANQICCEGAGSGGGDDDDDDRRNGSRGFCISQNRTCCGRESCSQNEICCRTSSRPFCANRNRTCCGRKSCGRNETCCGNARCCEQNERCVNGRCQASRADRNDDENDDRRRDER
jgi:hypothetical protein